MGLSVLRPLVFEVVVDDLYGRRVIAAAIPSIVVDDWHGGEWSSWCRCCCCCCSVAVGCSLFHDMCVASHGVGQQLLDL